MLQEESALLGILHPTCGTMIHEPLLSLVIVERLVVEASKASFLEFLALLLGGLGVEAEELKNVFGLAVTESDEEP